MWDGERLAQEGVGRAYVHRMYCSGIRKNRANSIDIMMIIGLIGMSTESLGENMRLAHDDCWSSYLRRSQEQQPRREM
jgi:hypothetical protein